MTAVCVRCTEGQHLNMTCTCKEHCGSVACEGRPRG